jgi:hypothetical protein
MIFSPLYSTWLFYIYLGQFSFLFQEEAYTYESSLELLEKDVVQFHAPRWQSMRKDVIGCTSEMDFFLWPRHDIDSIECLLFSRWKNNADEPYKPIKVR